MRAGERLLSIAPIVPVPCAECSGTRRYGRHRALFQHKETGEDRAMFLCDEHSAKYYELAERTRKPEAKQASPGVKPGLSMYPK